MYNNVLQYPLKWQYLNRIDQVEMFERDWDNLILLDACRYDKFEPANPFEADADPVVSKASQSGEFVDEYLAGETFHDCVYVTANPYGAQVRDDVFFDVHTTFDTDTGGGGRKATVENLNRSWSPETVAEAALEAHRQYPNKRLVVHFMQPHAPYFGETAVDLRDDLREEGYRFWAWNEEIHRESEHGDGVLSHLLPAAKRGLISTAQLEAVYMENLDIVLERIEELLDDIGGRSVITSDHGELLGEQYWTLPDVGHISNGMGHERNVYVDELREVPWLVLESEGRRDVTAEPPKDQDAVDEAELEEQLTALGYK